MHCLTYCKPVYALSAGVPVVRVVVIKTEGHDAGVVGDIGIEDVLVRSVDIVV